MSVYRALPFQASSSCRTLACHVFGVLVTSNLNEHGHMLSVALLGSLAYLSPSVNLMPFLPLHFLIQSHSVHFSRTSLSHPHIVFPTNGRLRHSQGRPRIDGLERLRSYPVYSFSCFFADLHTLFSPPIFIHDFNLPSDVLPAVYELDLAAASM